MNQHSVIMTFYNQAMAKILSPRRDYNFWGTATLIAPLFRNSMFMLHAWGKLRRFVLVHFRKEYMQQQLATRKGACSQCGFCCNLLFTCPLLTKKNECIVYGRCRPRACKAFPIDQRDIDEVKLSNATCGFYFQSKLVIDNDSTEN